MNKYLLKFKIWWAHLDHFSARNNAYRCPLCKAWCIRDNKRDEDFDNWVKEYENINVNTKTT